MQLSARRLTISCLIFAFAATWLGTVQPARAGDGGADLGSLQTFITGTLCPAVGINPCPQLPTITQAVLEIAGLSNTPPEIARANNNIAMGLHADAGNPSRPPAVNPPGVGDPKHPSQIGTSFPIDPKVLSTLRPLAFISAKNGTGPATPTQLEDSAANTFLYAVASTIAAGAPEPDTLFLFYDGLSRTENDFQKGSVAAKVSLPLTVLKGGKERYVPAILQFKAPNKSQLDCSASTVVGDFAGTGTAQSVTPPSKIGVNCAVVFGASPVSSDRHAIVEVSAPLLITAATDPAYFGNAISAWNPIFTADDPGFSLGANGSIGIAPGAVPFGPPVGTTSGTYSLCASLPGQGDEGDNQNLAPAVAAFYAIATDGETLLSVPLKPQPLANGKPSIVCPAGVAPG